MSSVLGGGLFTYEVLQPFVRKSASVYVYNDTQPASGVWTTAHLNTGIQAFCHFKCPDNMVSLDACDVVAMPNTTETISAAVAAHIAAPGEAHNTHIGTIASLSFVSTVDQLIEVSAIAALTLATAGDYVGFRLQGGGNEIELIGLRLKFTVAG